MALEQPHSGILIHGLVFRILGILMLTAGIGSLALGPLEMVCFTWFEEGGRFAYEGFGFGSFMFGLMAMQILGYYFIAAVLIPVGYGHLRLLPWAWTAILALIRCWVVLGVPLLAVVLFILTATKELAVWAGALAAVLAVFSYVALPGLLTRFYRSRGGRTAFGVGEPLGDAVAIRLDILGVPVLAVLCLEAFFVAALHILLFFNGLFPLLGGWATGLPGYVYVDVAILILLVIGWGTVRLRRWAWWAALAYFAAMGILWVGALVPISWVELLEVLAFSSYEVSLLDGIPLQGRHLAVFVALPIVGTLTAIVRARTVWMGSPRRNDDAAEDG